MFLKFACLCTQTLGINCPFVEGASEVLPLCVAKGVLQPLTSKNTSFCCTISGKGLLLYIRPLVFCITKPFSFGTGDLRRPQIRSGWIRDYLAVFTWLFKIQFLLQFTQIHRILNRSSWRICLWLLLSTIESGVHESLHLYWKPMVCCGLKLS